MTARPELHRQSRMAAVGSETLGRQVRVIDMADFDRRHAEIAHQLWDAAVDLGFFQLRNHGIPPADIAGAFRMTERYFALPEAVKARHPFQKKLNAGWESRAQRRPSVGTPDPKESYQITRPHMAALWPGEAALPAFEATMLAFERRAWEVAMRVLSCFAVKLGFARDFFSTAHDPSLPTYQSTLRLLHDVAIDPADRDRLGLWRAGAHTDVDCLTLLFQRAGQGGLQLLPGEERASEAWTPIVPADDLITCNIGDMLMRWSDDQLPSNLHRVRNPTPDEYQGPRYSLAFFAQANRDVTIQGPARKHAPISAEDYLQQRLAAHFSSMTTTR